jgi:C4-type Zn-finger protein
MKVEILRGVMIKGEPAEVGSILDLEANDAFLLISSNKAIAVTEELRAEIAPVEITPEVATVLEPVLEPVETTLQTDEELAPEEVVEVVENASMRTYPQTPFLQGVNHGHSFYWSRKTVSCCVCTNCKPHQCS